MTMRYLSRDSIIRCHKGVKVEDQILAYIGLILAVVIPVLGFGWRLLAVTSRVSETLDRVSDTITKMTETMVDNEVSHEQIVARMKVFETKMDAELKAINVRLDGIEQRQRQQGG